MSVDRSNEQTINDNGITNGQRKNNEDNISPVSSGRHSRNSRRSRDRSPKHKSRSDKGSSKKKKKERSVTPKRGRSRSKSADRQRNRHHERGRDNRNCRDERRRDERLSKRDRKSSYSRRDRSRDRTPPSSRRKYGRKSRRRRSTSSLSSDDEISNLKQSSTLSGLLMKKEDKKPKSKRRRKASSSSSSSSEDTRDSKPSVVNNAAVAESSQQQSYLPAAPYMNQQLGFPVQAMPPPSSAVPSYMPQSVLQSLPLMPPPLPPPIQQQSFYPPPPVPPPNNPMSSIPPPPVPPPAHRQHSSVLPPVPRAPKPPKYNRPIVLNKTIRKIESCGDWGSGSVSKYHIVKQVGEGTYGQVYKADNGLGSRFALKKVRLDNEREGFPITAVREIKILRQLTHTNVVQLMDIVTDQTSAADLRTNNANFYLVFEYVDHDLTGLLEAAHNKLIPDFLPTQIAVMFKQLLSGLEYCHSKKFLHRDIKCSNILVNNKGELKIADWGLARLYHDDHERLYTNRVITLWYRPPELLLGAEHYGPAVDVWSVGCILAEFFTKKAVFMGQHEAEQLLLISSLCGTPTPEVWPDVVNMPLYRTMKPKKMEFRRVKEEFSSIMPSPAIDLLDKMIMLDPKKRLTASDALKHQWIRHIDPSKVPPLQLPCGQDCHELWSKKQKKERKSGILPAGTLETIAVPVLSQSRESLRKHGTGADNSDGDNSRAWQGFSALITNTNDPTNFLRVQDFLNSISEANCQAIVHELSRQGQGLTENFGTGRDKLLALTSRIFGYSPQVQHVVPPAFAQHPSLGHNPSNVPPHQPRMHR